MTDKWLNVNEIAKLISIDPRSVSRKAIQDSWQYRSYSVRGGKERRYHLASLSEKIQTAYAASIKLTLADLQSLLKPDLKPEKKINIPRYSGRGAKTKEVKTIKETPQEYLQIAALRRKVLEAYSASGLNVRQFVTAYNNGVIMPDVRDSQEKLSQTNLYRWLELYEQKGLTELAPQYSKNRGGSGASIDEQAKELIQTLWLDPNKPGVKSVWRKIKNQFGYNLNYSTVNNYVNNKIPLSVKIYYRLGEKAYQDRCDPYIERDYTLFKSMEWGCGDHHLFDFVIKHEGRIFRPWLTMFTDMRSRKITGWHIDVVPNTLTIMRAFSMSVETCSLFENLLVDNGKDFKSAWFAGNGWKMRRTMPEKETLELIEGVLHDCGTKAHFATPYHGQSKPIERAFRTIIELFSREQSTWVGSNTVDRKADTNLYWGKINGRDRIEVTYTLNALREDFAKFVAWFNAEWEHSGQGMGGNSPDNVFAKYLEGRREMPQEMRKYIFAIRQRRTVQKKGICIDGIDYYSDEMTRLIGEKVEVRRDINDAGKISIFSLPDFVYRFDAENYLLKDRGIPEENIRRLKNAKKKARAHLQDYAKRAAEVRNEKKTPYELYAEQKAETYAEEPRKVVNGDPVSVEAPPVLHLVKPAKKIIKTPFNFDIDVD
jgi:transposase InsO family protein/DNA-binding transcriptional ArsR family regulator